MRVPERLTVPLTEMAGEEEDEEEEEDGGGEIVRVVEGSMARDPLRMREEERVTLPEVETAPWTTRGTPEGREADAEESLDFKGGGE